MDRRALILITAAMFLLMITFKGESQAKIPEPPNYFYGTVVVDGAQNKSGMVTMVLKGQNDPIASYEIGSIQEAGDYYVLKVPLDAMEPRMTGKARTGDAAKIYVNGKEAKAVVIGNRGTIHLVNLTIGIPKRDTDGDGILDSNDDFPTNPNEWLDTDGDGMGDNYESFYDLDPLVDDANEDFDGDRFSNLREFICDSDPTDPGYKCKVVTMPWLNLLLGE